MKLLSLFHDNHADVKMVGAVVGILVTIIVSVLVFYNIAGSIDLTTADANVNAAMGYTGDQLANTSWATNSSDSILDQAATFYSIAPIIAIVVVAVVILGYVSRIGG